MAMSVHTKADSRVQTMPGSGLVPAGTGETWVWDMDWWGNLENSIGGP